LNSGLNMQLLTAIIIGVTCGLSARALPQNNGSQAQDSAMDEVIAAGVRSFAIDLLKYLHQNAKPEDNLLISPMNIYTALAFLHLGAAGNTRNELADVLGLPKDDQRVAEIHESFSRIAEKMQNKSKDPYDVTTETIMANGIFVQKKFPIREEYIQLMKKYYNNGNVTNLDFAGHSKEATDTINNWVSEKTKGRIPQIFASPLDQDVVMVLTASLYFCGKWKEPFYKASTKVEKFNTGVTDIQVHMMQRVEYVPYINDPEMQVEAISIPYWGGEYSMVVILPHTSQSLANLTKVIDSNKLGKILKNCDTIKVDYKIPRTKFSWQQSLNQPLVARGLNSVFTDPDFSPMTSVGVGVSDITHATEMDIDEEGTKASAITAIQIVPLSGQFEWPPKEPKPFYVNRPFMVNIYYHPKNIILFSALIHKPSEVSIGENKGDKQRSFRSSYVA
jgi:serpin B